MKKLLLVSIAVLSLLTIAACGNKNTTVSNKKEAVFTIGDEKITREDLYKELVEFDQGETVQNLALEKFVELEITVTDEMKQEVEDEINELKEEGTLTSTLSAYGMDEESYREYLLSSIQTEKLYDAYIEQNYDTLFENTKPYKAKMIYIEIGDDADAASEKADKALAEIKAGGNFEEIASKYSDDTDLAEETYYTRNTTTDSNVLKFVLDGENLSDKITSSDGEGYYIVQVTERNAEQLREEFTSKLKSGTTIYDDTIQYFAKKYQFALYDYKIYTYFKSNYSEFIYD